MKHLSFTIFCAVLCGALVGCGKKLPDGLPNLLPCSVIVTQEGKPLSDAAVALVPQDGKWSANGVSDANGIAKMYTSGQYEGVVAGKYKVCITKTEIIPGKPLPNSDTSEPDQSFTLVEPQYRDQKKTPLTVDIAEGTKEYKVDAGKAVRTAINED